MKAQITAVKSKATHDKAQQSVPLQEPDAIAMAEVESHLEDINHLLNRNGLTWVTRTGYVTVWNRINKADEAMINILPTGQVIEGANYDILKLTGSKVPDNKDLIEQLKNALNLTNDDHKSWHNEFCYVCSGYLQFQCQSSEPGFRSGFWISAELSYWFIETADQ